MFFVDILKEYFVLPIEAFWTFSVGFWCSFQIAVCWVFFVCIFHWVFLWTFTGAVFVNLCVILIEICTCGVVHRLNSTSANLLITNSNSTNFIATALKFVLVEFLLVETALLGDLPVQETAFNPLTYALL